MYLQSEVWLLFVESLVAFVEKLARNTGSAGLVAENAQIKFIRNRNNFVDIQRTEKCPIAIT